MICVFVAAFAVGIIGRLLWEHRPRRPVKAVPLATWERALRDDGSDDGPPVEDRPWLPVTEQQRSLCACDECRIERIHFDPVPMPDA